MEVHEVKKQVSLSALLSFLAASLCAQTHVHWGSSELTPVAGDYDGDGRGDYALYHEVSGGWYILSAENTLIGRGLAWGGPDLAAVPGDYDGDGVADLAVYHRSDAGWFVYSLAKSGVLSWDTRHGV